MARPEQLKFLTALRAELNRIGSTEGNIASRVLYNVRATTFYVDVPDMQTAIKASLLKGIEPSQRVEMEKAATDLNTAVEVDIKNFISTMGNIFDRQGSDKAKVVFEKDGVLAVAVFPTGGDTFKRIKGLYNHPLTKLFDAIQAKALTGVLSPRRGSTFQLEHDHFIGILETTMQDALHNVITSTKSENTTKQVKDWLESQDVDVQIIRDGERERMSVFLGSSVVNDAEGKDAQRKKKVLLQVLDDALDKLSKDPDFSFIGLAGSDSIMTARRKKLIRDTTKQFKKQKHVKVTTENIVIKTSKTNNKEKFGPERVVATALNRATKVRKSSKTKKSAASMPMTEMLARFNARINQEVLGNMESPALVNRTGRFAQSVRVTDVIKTPRGFNSVGYTYQRNPYQTFEMGGAQGDPDKDPRKIIEQSMRDIAVSFAVGRFYFRRL